MKYYPRKIEKEAIIDLFVMTYDTLDVTKDFLKAIYSHTNREDFHLILLDNGSKDGTEEYLKDFQNTENNISIIINDSNEGPMVGRNKCYEFNKTCSKKSPLISFLDNDQFVQKGWLDSHLKVLKNKDLIGIEAWQLNSLFIPVAQIHSTNQTFSYVGTGGMLFKREIPENIGLMDERYSPAYYEDPDFVFSTHKAGYKIGWNYKAKVIHLAHKTLGKIPQEKKQIIFQNSWKKFREKWNGFSVPVLRQEIVKDL